MTARGSEAVSVFLMGEGANELGSRAGDPAYQSDDRPGVLHTLLRKVQPTGWQVRGARDWKSIRKFRVRSAPHEDARNVLGAALDAKEAGCEVLVFSRDLDKDPARKVAIEDAIRSVPSTLESAPEIIGGVAVPTLEGWILALLGESTTEELTPKQAEKALTTKGLAPKDTEAMVRVVENADLRKIPSDASSLSQWLKQAEDVLPRRVAELDRAKSSRTAP